jgi:hypothetical protein
MSTAYREYKHYIPILFRTVGAHLSTSEPDTGALVATLLSETNPGQADVSLPTFIGEMKDFPRTIKSIGDGFRSVSKGRTGGSKELSSHYLTWQFGIKPLISDIRKLMDFESNVAKRLRVMQKIYERGGLRRKRVLYTEEKTQSDVVTIESSLGTVVDCNRTTTTEVKIWGTVRWIPTTPPPNYTDAQARTEAIRLIFGLNAQNLLYTAWELLPWSWLIDWFANVQDFLQSNNNALPAKATDVCIMVHRKTTCTYTRSNPNNWIWGGDCTQSRETKTRLTHEVGLNTNLPLLSGKKLSILGALAINRFSR